VVASGIPSDAPNSVQQTAGSKQLSVANSGASKHHVVNGGIAASKRQASSKENNNGSCSLPQNLHGAAPSSGFVDMKFNKLA